MQALIVLLYRNSIYNNVGCNKHLFVCFYLVFLTSGQDCNSGMQKRIHFRTNMEHHICRPLNNSDNSLGYQFCKNITFILYIIYNVRYNNRCCSAGNNIVCSRQSKFWQNISIILLSHD